jgi:D-aminoacyl-tRNA deacylase
MRFAIAYGKDDPAGNNIVEQINKTGFLPQIPIIKLKKHPIYSENIDKLPEFKNIDFIIFASTHRSEKGTLSLSLHAPGNWRNADFGGQPGKICNTSADILKYLFQNLNKIAENNKLKDYQITLECTHHGPLIQVPCCFIEIGSNEEQWKDKQAGKIIARTILSLQNYKPNKDYISCIGIGGPHYCPSFNKIQLNSNYAVSHIIPQYNLPLTEDMLKQAEQKTTEQIKEVLIDWKGCGKSEQRQEIIKIIEKAGLKYKRASDINKD